MEVRSIIPILLVLSSTAASGQTIIELAKSSCVNGHNIFICTGEGEHTHNWSIPGSHDTPVILGGGVRVEFNWTGTGTNLVISCGQATFPPFDVYNNVSTSVSMTPTSVSIVYGTMVTFNVSSPINGGTTPAYQWFLNSNAVSGQTGTQYAINHLQDGDQVYVRMHSSATCPQPEFANSNTVTASVTYPLSPPTVSDVSAPFDTSAILSAEGATGNELYRWCDAPTGGTCSQGLTFSTPVLDNHKTYYVSKFNPSTLAESTRVPQTVTLVVPPPEAPAMSTNTCGKKTLTRGSPPDKITWNWQGIDPNGTVTNFAATYTVEEADAQLYYLRAKATTANIWSTPVAIKVSTNPVDITLDSYQPQNPVIQASHSIVILPGFTVPSGSDFTARIAITPECNDIYNWSEEIVYDQNQQPLSRSRVFVDGMGQALQNQSVDYNSRKVWLSQPLYDIYGKPAGGTLSAPIREHDFIYKPNFVQNEDGEPYSESDFDLRTTTSVAESGEINYPRPVGKQPGTLGWYYSSNNNLEPHTPVTDFPYSRSFTPEDPDPTTSTSAGPGDAHRMGSGHEVKTERQPIGANDLDHYLSLRSHFVDSSLSVAGYKYITTGPDGKQVVSFVDADGRALASATLDESVFDNWSYSYYNDLGQLVASVAPNGVNTGSSAYPQFVTTYHYDHLGRMIETTSSDEGTSRFVYSTDGKIRFSQNQEQENSSPKRFSYTNYDYLGRLIESGEYTSDTQYGDTTFVFDVTTPSGSNSVLNIVDSVGFSGVSRKLDADRCSEHTFIYYDRENFDGIASPPASFQENLEGQVSRTENENAITLYSYDEFGQVIKTWQLIKVTEPDVARTVDYTYDYFGNVTEVAYQKDSVDDRFYHHYVYDLNQRLTEVHTSRNGSNKTLRAKYEYYLHGPLKRMELFDGNEELQGIDYTYTIDGSLKTINHADASLDPGGDGNDVFGETLQYFDNDYAGADYSAGTQTISGYNNQYGGLLKGMSWHSPAGNHEKQTYAYQYDDRNQLTNAVWGAMTGSAGAYGFSPADAQAYREAVPGYDKNGNIQSLVRKGKEGSSLANYDYVYEANTNKLDKVDHNSSVFVDYTYNSIGQMTRQVEGEDMDFEIIYNAYGLVAEIRDNNDSGNILQSYHYDDRGNLLQKVFYSGGVAQLYTTYVSDAAGNVLAIYQQGTAALAAEPAEVPVYGAGRIAVYKPSAEAYFYEVSDHLGNVRAVIGVAETEIFSTGFETSSNSDFENYSRQDDDYMDHTDAGTVYTYSQLLNGGYAGRVGLAKSLAVSPGDVIKVEAYGKYRTVAGSPETLAGFAGMLTGAFGLTSGVPGDPGMAFDAMDVYGTAIEGGFDHFDDPNDLKAFLNIILFDKNHNFVDAAYRQVDGDAIQPTTDPMIKTSHDYLVREVTVTEPGFAYVFFSNEEDILKVDVHFDDVKITHTHSNVVAGADYYPFGLVMDGREIDDEPYRYGYQGQFSEKDLTTGMQEFELRNYDARIGRWTTPDPYGQYASPYLGMGNLPHVLLDKNGGFVGCCPELALSASTAGSSIGTAIFGGQLAEIVIESTFTGTFSGALPAIVASTMVEISNGLMFQGIDKSWYASFPTNEGSYILKHQNGDWQMHRNEPYLRKAYAENLVNASNNVAELYTTLISSVLGGFSVSTGLRSGVTQNAARSSTTAFRSFTSSNFRTNLGRLTGNVPANSQAHHIFPQKYLSEFSKRGINIHDPKFGAWWETSGHLKNAAGYNAAWGNFFRAYPNATQSQILNQGRTLMQQYGIPVGF